MCSIKSSWKKDVNWPNALLSVKWCPSREVVFMLLGRTLQYGSEWSPKLQLVKIMLCVCVCVFFSRMDICDVPSKTQSSAVFSSMSKAELTNQLRLTPELWHKKGVGGSPNCFDIFSKAFKKRWLSRDLVQSWLLSLDPASLRYWCEEMQTLNTGYNPKGLPCPKTSVSAPPGCCGLQEGNRNSGLVDLTTEAGAPGLLQGLVKLCAASAGFIGVS